MSNQTILELEKAMKTESPSPNPLPVGEGKASQPGRVDTSLKGGVKGPPLLAQFSKSVGPDGRVEFVGVAAAVSLRGTDVVIMAGDRARLLLVLQEMAPEVDWAVERDTMATAELKLRSTPGAGTRPTTAR